MKKYWSILITAALVLALLCGCGNAASYDKAESATSPSYNGMAGGVATDSAAWDEMEYYEPGEMQTSNAVTGSDFAGEKAPSLPANVKLIYTANIDLESTEFDAVLENLNRLVAEMGGYFERSELNNYSRYRSGFYTVRVPAAAFDGFCAGVSGLCQVNNINRSAEDVSEHYYDLESRLATQQTKLERLQELLAKAENMEDIITLEYAISDTELAIEQLTGSLRHYDSLVGYSTVYISLSEVYKLTEIEQPAIGFGAKLAAAFRSGCSRFVDNLQDFLLDLARAWVGWLIFIVIVVVAFLLIRRGVRRRSERRDAGELPPRRERKARKQTNADPEAAQPNDENK